MKSEISFLHSFNEIHINSFKKIDHIKYLNEMDELSDNEYEMSINNAKKFIEKVHNKVKNDNGLNNIFQKIPLNSSQGKAMLSLAEAFLRVPDNKTADELIKEKLVGINWQVLKDISGSKYISALATAASYAEKLIINANTEGNSFIQLIARTTLPLIRNSIAQAMNLIGNNFVMSTNILDAIKKSSAKCNSDFLFSYDMLGEAAITWHDADTFYDLYSTALNQLSEQNQDYLIHNKNGISVKLSALVPQFYNLNKENYWEHLYNRVLSLAKTAAKHNLPFNIDAEEVDKLSVTLEVFYYLLREPDLANWSGLGLAVQAYQVRSLSTIDWLINQARENNRKICIRLVKGAYWDTEIKIAQQLGLIDYPVFTQKSLTDYNFIIATQKLFKASDCVYSQIATHNANSIMITHTLAKKYDLANDEFEFQLLFGMGETLYQEHKEIYQNYKYRIYAPIGEQKTLLSYLVRRLLENGANSSFIHNLADNNIDIEKISASPKDIVNNLKNIENIKQLKPPYKSYSNLHSQGLDIRDPIIAQATCNNIKQLYLKETLEPGAHQNPATLNYLLSSYKQKSISSKQCLDILKSKSHHCLKLTLNQRCDLLIKLANLLVKNQEKLLALLQQVAGKTIVDAIDEWREAYDFCQYYVDVAKNNLAPKRLSDVVGEENILLYEGLGVCLCISPWNFPLAIFLGQIAQGFISGNYIIAKPAEQTLLIAEYIFELMLESGWPKDSIYLINDSGINVSDNLISNKAVQSILFTGSTKTAAIIRQNLAKTSYPDVVFIAETGGLNAMIADSSILPEQLVQDCIKSGFYSAGQRCSALRVLYLQEEIADHIEIMLKDAMQVLTIGDPINFANNIGPIIDLANAEKLTKYIKEVDPSKVIAQTPISDTLPKTFVPPTLIKIDNINEIPGEIFGPIIHIRRYKSQELNEIIKEINSTNYGLTFGIHSRLNKKALHIANKINSGNIYINRNITGAIVGAQPFGGRNLSGTGPKAGGPWSLYRLVHEKTISENTAAIGGDPNILMEEY